MRSMMIFGAICFFITMCIIPNVYAQMQEETVQITQTTQTVQAAQPVRPAQTVIKTTVTEEVIEQVPVSQEPSFGAKMWKGTKAGARWTWKGIKKIGFYIKEGTVSFLETTGMKRKPDEGIAHDKILEDANRTLIESRTRRELRNLQNQQDTQTTTIQE